MSVFASLVTKTLPVPGAPGESITIRKLAPKHLEAAIKATRTRTFDDVMVTAAVLAIGKTAPQSDAKQLVNDPLLKFDRATVIAQGVLSWTFADKRCPDDIDDLDDETQTWLASAILKLTKPALFQSEEEREGERKNG